MLDLNEMKLILIVGLHTVANAMATGEMQKAIFYTLYAVSCYFIIMGTVWFSNKVFFPTKAKPAKQPRKPRARRTKEKVDETKPKD